MRINGHNRQARKRSLSNTFTPTQWQQALDYFNGCCAVCGNQLKDLFGEVTVHADHWIPLTSSECPGTIATNMICLCNKCNLSKHNTMPVVWLRRRYSERKARQIEKRIAEYFEWLRKR
jgi:predicted HNH restriction endonuclease